MKFHEIPWKVTNPMNFHVISWNFMEYHDLLLGCYDEFCRHPGSLENVCPSSYSGPPRQGGHEFCRQEIHEPPWDPMKFHEILWVSRFLQNSMDFAFAKETGAVSRRCAKTLKCYRFPIGIFNNFRPNRTFPQKCRKISKLSWFPLYSKRNH